MSPEVAPDGGSMTEMRDEAAARRSDCLPEAGGQQYDLVCEQGVSASSGAPKGSPVVTPASRAEARATALAGSEQ